jgi:hypothetical protein
MKMFLSTCVIAIGLITFVFGILLLSEASKKDFLKIGNFKILAARYKGDPDRLWLEVSTKHAATGLSFNHDMTSAYMPLSKSLIKDGHTIGFTANKVISGDWQLQGKVHLLKDFLKRHPTQDEATYRISFKFKHDKNIWDNIEAVPVEANEETWITFNGVVTEEVNNLEQQAITLLRKLAIERGCTVGKMYRSSVVLEAYSEKESIINYMNPGLLDDLNIQFKEVTPGIVDTDGEAKWIEWENKGK